ncbi:iron-siderophore ABC transporter substrate-binding protein [Streptomyces sp. ODS05-4]|uniref:iron-siderophore ABC transporter substrate-binding protein n=1 Tax=Streptomyces sp. ODS05-4 TaxID=2944939 RepID=UPI002109B510|nr:iron-siderophore ABC transporter substrate-binding protein [Streptomyces sp. ODS05-4]
MRRLIATSAAAIAAALALTACGTTEPTPAKSDKPAEKINLTDAKGAKVTLDGPAKKVVATEWNVVEALVSLGVDPAGVSDVKGYQAWGSTVPLKNEPKDVGTRGEPSMDTIAALSPDLIVATTDLPPAAVKQLRKVAPVLEIRPADAADQVGRMKGNLDLIAQATGRTEQAETVKKSYDDKVAEGRKALADAGLAGKPIAFADGYAASNQVSIRPFTSGSLIGSVNEELGLKNAWKMAGDKDYGLAATDVEGLTAVGDVPFAYISNDAEGDPFAKDLAGNGVWKSLPFVKNDKVHKLPDGIWMFGGPKSMEAYVDALVSALTKK